MLKWLFPPWRASSSRRKRDVAEDRQALIAERGRLRELLDSYREFGFEALIPHCKERIRHIDETLRRLHEPSRRA